LLLGGSTVARADDAAETKAVMMSVPSQGFDDAVRDVLMRHPEIIRDSMQAYQAQQEAKQQETAQAAIGSESSKIYDDKDSPVAGNPEGKETLVEFFDYQCHYCKQIHPELQTLIHDDGNLKVIFKDFPILGPGSTLAAKAALAAKMQDKYLPMHNALLDYKGQFDDDAIKQVAQGVGVDYDKLKADMEKPEISQQLSDNLALAEKLNIHGTPSMIINHQFVGGALPLDELKKKLADNKAG
jgi:protein-disulfide isomerase